MLLTWTLGTCGVLASLYGLHRLMLCLERYDWRGSWREASGSGGYHPLLEIYQPQVRHVVEAREQQPSDDDDSGAPLLTSGQALSAGPAPAADE